MNEPIELTRVPVGHRFHNLKDDGSPYERAWLKTNYPHGELVTVAVDTTTGHYCLIHDHTMVVLAK